MDTSMNKKQQVTENQQAENPQCNTLRNKNVSIRHDNIPKVFLIPCPLRHKMTRWKHHRMTYLIQLQGKT